MLTEDEFKDFLKALGKRIRALRRDKQLNMRDIMISTGYHDAQWRKYEAGGSLNIMSLMKVALALEVSLVELLDGLEQWPLQSVAEIESKVPGALPSSNSDDLTSDPAEQKPKTRKRLLVKSSRVADTASSTQQATQTDTKRSSRASSSVSA